MLNQKLEIIANFHLFTEHHN